MLGKLAEKLGRKWLAMLLVLGMAGMVALSGCTFRGEGEAEDDNDDDNDVDVGDDDNNDDTASGEVKGEGSPGLAWIAALGALGGVAYAARRRLN